MKVTEKKLEGAKLELVVDATAEEVNRVLDIAEQEFAQRMNLRPDGVRTIEQTAREELGVKDLVAVVAPTAAELLIPFALDKRNIMPAFPPNPPKGENLKRDQPYSFRIQVTPKPEYELTSYDKVDISITPFSVSPTEVDAELARLADQYATFETVDPRPVQSHDDCLIAMKVRRGEEAIDALTTEGRTYTVGAGLMPPDFDHNILGMNVGEEKTFSFMAPGYDEQGNPIEEEYEATVTVKELQRRVIPAITDEWVAQNMPFYGSASALREATEAKLAELNKAQYDMYCRQVAAEELAKRFRGSIADETYESMRDAMAAGLRAELAQQGISFEEYVQQNGGEQQFGMMLMVQVRETLVQGYALDAIYRFAKLTLTEEDIIAACKLMNPHQPQVAREQMESTGRGFALREIAERLKANQWLFDHHANVTIVNMNKEKE